MQKLVLLFFVFSLRSFATIGTEIVDGIEWLYLVSEEEVSIFGYSSPSGLPESIRIPATLGGCPVTGIGFLVFHNCPNLKEIAIPDSILSIDRLSFYDCPEALLDTNSIPGVMLVDGWAIGHRGNLSGCLDLTSVRGIAGDAFSYSSELTAVHFSDELKGIGRMAFAYCSGLTNIVIPKNVASIENYAFEGCSGLLSISIDNNNSNFDSRNGCNAIIHSSDNQLIVGCRNTVIPASVTSIDDGAFYNCAGLKTITIPEGLTNIGGSAFFNCSGLESISIPDSVLSIGENAFYGCSGLDSINLPDGVLSIGGHAFVGCPDAAFDTSTIPGTRLLNGWAVGLQDGFSGPVDLSCVRGIDDEMFSYNDGITSVILPTNHTHIRSQMFSHCSELESVKIPFGVTNISDSAFSGCSKLTSISIPDSVTSIGNSAFAGCSSLTDVTIPASAISLGHSLFMDCSSITSVVLRSNPPTAWPGYQIEINDDGSFSQTDSYTSMFWNCPGPIHVELGQEITEIGSLAFAGCSGIVSITIPESVTNIGGRAFLDCSDNLLIDIDEKNERFSIADGILFSKDKAKIVEVVKKLPANWMVPESVETIQDGALSGHTEILSIAIPPSVTNIGEYAFENCSGLLSVGLPNGMKRIPDGMFSGCSGLSSISVPEGVTSIGCQVFSGCVNLQNINLPEGVAVVGQDAFKQCSNLKTLSIPGSVLTLANDLFCGCANMEEIVLPRHFQPIVGRFGIPESTTIRYADVSTLTSPIPVSHAWLERYPGLLAEHGDDYENASNGEAANGKNTVWECYLAGIDPTDASAALTCSIGMKGEKPSFSWNPDLGEARSYNIVGKTDLADLEWKPGPVANQRFFKVKVQPPTITYYGEF